MGCKVWTREGGFRCGVCTESTKKHTAHCYPAYHVHAVIEGFHGSPLCGRSASSCWENPLSPRTQIKDGCIQPIYSHLHLPLSKSSFPRRPSQNDHGSKCHRPVLDPEVGERSLCKLTTRVELGNPQVSTQPWIRLQDGASVTIWQVHSGCGSERSGISTA